MKLSLSFFLMMSVTSLSALEPLDFPELPLPLVSHREFLKPFAQLIAQGKYKMPLLAASEQENVSFIKDVAPLVDINYQEEADGKMTYLMRAASLGKVASVAALLAQKADPNLHNIAGSTALTFAVAEEHASCLELLTGKAHEETINAALCNAARLPTPRCLKILLQRADANCIEPGGAKFTPLHIAAACGHPDAVKELLEAGARSHVRNVSNYLPLQLAEDGATDGHVACAILLRKTMGKWLTPHQHFFRFEQDVKKRPTRYVAAGAIAAGALLLAGMKVIQYSQCYCQDEENRVTA